MTALLRLLVFLSVVLPLGALHAADKPVALPMNQRWQGDLPELLERRAFRLIVPYSKTQFSLYLGKESGVAAEFGREYERWLNARYRKGKLPLTLVSCPFPRTS